MSQVTFVTCWFHLYKKVAFDDRTVEWRFKHFEVILKTGIQICIYVDNESYPKICELAQQYANLRVMASQDLEDTDFYKIYETVRGENIDLVLPQERHNVKDSLEFMILMNSKLQFMNDAIAKNPWNSTHFGWIDFSIAYILSDPLRFTEHLKMLSVQTYRERILVIPGCVSEFDGKDYNALCEMPYWRFCGGFFISDKQSMTEFHDLFYTHCPEFLRKHKRVVWEVNYWAWLEYEKGLKVTWYSADHNDSIVYLPAESFLTPLAPVAQKVVYPYPPLFHEDNEYLPSSASYICYQGQHILNTRFVNYSFNVEGRYAIRDAHKILHTKNIRSYLDATLNPKCYGLMSDESVRLASTDRFSHGLEDMRLFEHNGGLWFIASNVNYSPSGKIRMMIGLYHPETLTYSNCQVLTPPTDTSCDKNWIPINDPEGKLYFIYSWSPYRLGVLDAEFKLNIVLEHAMTAPYFHKVRGSSIFVRDGDALLGVVHFSEEGCPRKYYHMLVRLDPVRMVPIAYSDPFCFQHYGVEFCVGFAVLDDDQYVFWVSKKDNDGAMITVDRSQFPMKNV